MTHICLSKLTIIGSDNGLSPGRCQAIIWTNAGILLIGTLRTNFNESLIEYPSFSFKKMHMKNAVWKMAAILPRPQCVKAEWNDYFSREVVAMTVEAIPVLAVVVIFDSLCVSSPHYLKQCWVIVNWTLRKKIPWIFSQNTKFFIHDNSFKNIVCEKAAILSRGVS